MIGRHRIQVVRSIPTGAPLDPDGLDGGHPAAAPTIVATVAGVIQPRSGRERASVQSDDVNIGTHRIYLAAEAVPIVQASDKLRKDSSATGDSDADLDGDYTIEGVQNAAGIGHHLEVDATRLIPQE